MLKLAKLVEKNVGLMIFGILLVSAVGGLVQIVPSLANESLSLAEPGVKPYSALELAGRDIYIRESCALCHSQQIRPFVTEVKRYGPYSRAGEFVYDRPFLWGSKRTGPDLARVGGEYSDEWHRIHMNDPRAVVPSSIMPGYPWLAKTPLDAGDLRARMDALVVLGHPYSEADLAQASPDVLAGKTELDAVIAYLQSLGNSSVTQ